MWSSSSRTCISQSRRIAGALLAAMALLSPHTGLAQNVLKEGTEKWYLERGRSNMEIGNYKAAIEAYQKATELKPNEVQGWNNLGVAKAKTDDKTGAIVAYQKAIALKPNDAELHFGLATVYRRQRKTDEAIAEYQVAVEKDPKFAKAYYDLGIMYSQEKKTAEARAAFEKYLQYGTTEDSTSRKDAEDRLSTFKGMGK